MQPIQLPALRPPSQVYQASPSVPLHTGSLPRFMGSPSPPTYPGFDTPPATTTGYACYLPSCTSNNSGGRTTNGVPSSSSIIATPSTLRSMATGTPISVTDVPPSLSSFKTITGSIHAPPPCEWTCDTVPFFPQLHYDYYPLDKSASGSTASSPSLQTHPPTSFRPDLFDPSSAMSYPQLNSGAPTSFPGMMTLPGSSSSSQFASAPDITQSLRSARANPSPREITTRMTTTASTATRATKSETQTRAREKRHGCWMCEKSFDRPSTLRKHLLVHTGVKAFVCETCGRRFGVASNLNRHIKRCVLKPVNLASRTGQSNIDGHSSNGSSVESAGTNVPESSTSPAPLQPIKRAREPEAAEASEASAHSSASSSATGSAPKPPTKRRRRAPSPSQWVPQSLAHFNILPYEYKGTSVPLPPVSPARDSVKNEWIEERNSWDDETTPSPYHPYGWKGVLPGPGLASGIKDGSDDGLVNGGTYVMGRLVMV